MSNYAEWTTRMAIAQNKLGWALRDRKPLDARKQLAEIKACVEALDAYLNPEATVPPGWLQRLNSYLGGG